MSDMINVLYKPLFDESIIKKEYHSYTPYLPTFKNNDEIRIPIQNQDLYVLLSESLLYIEGFISNKDSTISKTVKLTNNCMAYLFEEIRYEMNGIEIDRTRQLGIASDMKNYVSLNEFESKILWNAGWCPFDDENTGLKTGHFNFCIPLKNLLGFAEDFDKILVNCKHELILMRSKDDKNIMKSTTATDNLMLKLLNITWKVPHIQLSDTYRLKMLKTINSKQPLNISFRSWDVYHNPSLPESTNILWNVKLVGENERPRYILLAFLRENNFQHCNLTDVKVHLNSCVYPYDDLNLRFDHNRYALLYVMYEKFQQSYYGRTPQPLLSPKNFAKIAPIIVLDVTHQNESVKGGPIDIRIELKFHSNVQPNTSAYCMLVHDKMFEYVPLTNDIKKII